MPDCASHRDKDNSAQDRADAKKKLEGLSKESAGKVRHVMFHEVVRPQWQSRAANLPKPLPHMLCMRARKINLPGNPMQAAMFMSTCN